MLPSPPEEIDTKFYFYSTKNRSERPLIELPFLSMTSTFENLRNRSKQLEKDAASENITNSQSEQSLRQTTDGPSTTPRFSSWKKNQLTLDDMKGFDNMSVRIIVHGFGSTCSHVWIYEMRTALMAVVMLFI